jgi:ribonuclease P protein subunit POP4
MISARNILRHELIGLDVLVAEASNPFHRGICGRVIDETRNTLLIRTPCGDRMVPKQHSCFRFTLEGGVQVEVDGSALIMAPERRVTLNIKQ